MIKVLLVGQKTPPHVGQFVMNEQLINSQNNQIKVSSVKMNFSKSVGEIGVLSIRKVFHLFGVILRIWIARIRLKPDVLYYPPAGPHLVPIYRDILLLISTRWLFKKTVFHFHAGGISETYQRMSPINKWLFEKAYFHADLAIKLAPDNPDDGVKLKAKQNIVIPNGIKDYYASGKNEGGSKNTVPNVLFLGMLRKTKGLYEFLEACNIVKSMQLEFSARLVGGFVTEEEAELTHRYIYENGLDEIVEIAGILKGEKKWGAYRDADIFCMPSYYESETFGLVAIEAMQFKLPVVATRWRGLNSIVLDGETGFLVPIKDGGRLAEKIAYLISHRLESERMGENGRIRYLENYTEQVFISSVENAILSLNYSS